MERASTWHDELLKTWESSDAGKLMVLDYRRFHESDFMRDRAEKIFKQLRFLCFAAMVNKRNNVLFRGYWAQMRPTFTYYSFLIEDDLQWLCKVPAASLRFDSVPMPRRGSKLHLQYAKRTNEFNAVEWYSKRCDDWQSDMVRLVTLGLGAIDIGEREGQNGKDKRLNVQYFNKTVNTMLNEGRRLRNVSKTIERFAEAFPNLCSGTICKLDLREN